MDIYISYKSNRGSIKQILHCDWLHEGGKSSHISSSGLPAVFPHHKSHNKSFVCSLNMVGYCPLSLFACHRSANVPISQVRHDKCRSFGAHVFPVKLLLLCVSFDN